ncbi:MAG: hypothetical protein GX339_10405, partial [Tissierellia bacterium]|nr:hypothetical protein [Tissierellia bacterium]
TGMADQATIDKIEELLSTSLQLGTQAEEVIQLKKDLVKLGFGQFEYNQNYGPTTKRTVEAFQLYYGLRVSGIVDERTLGEINNILNSPLREGQSHDDTVQLKKDLVSLGFGSFEYNKDYGPKTAKVVGEFQEYYGLRVNYIADQPTLNKLREILNSPLRINQQHEETIRLKEKLSALGYGNFDYNKSYGPKTEAVVKEFQRTNGLVVNGIADEVTLKTLQELYDKNVVKLFIDPGHGGHDPGGRGYGLMEKYVVLDIALKTAETLTTQYIGIDVKMSRKTDSFVELEERARMANDWGADFFLSIHSNAYNYTSRGFESFILRGTDSTELKQRQRDIHTYLINKIGTIDRGMKQANFSVLRNTNMQALLLEYLFIDNIEENALLKDAKYREWLGEITAEAIAYTFKLKRK